MRRIALLLLLTAPWLSAGGCGTATDRDVPQPSAVPQRVDTPAEDPAPKIDSIGSAHMEQDGTIVLQLRAEGEAGDVGDALLRYAPADERYEEVQKHLGGLQPGESKPVPPWPNPQP